MSTTPLHDWLRPRLDLLLAEANAAGFEREAALAVLTDIATSATYNEVALPTEPELPHNAWPKESDQTTPYLDSQEPENIHRQWAPTFNNRHDRLV